MSVFVNGDLVISGSGSYLTDTYAGEEFNLSWIAKGNSKSTFRVSVVEPTKVGYSEVKLIGKDKENCGTEKITIT